MYPIIAAFLAGFILRPLVTSALETSTKMAIKGTVATYEAGEAAVGGAIDAISSISNEALAELKEEKQIKLEAERILDESREKIKRVKENIAAK